MTLEQKALEQFDRLLKNGELLWTDNAPRIIEFEPFNFEFRVASSLKKKPQNEEEDKETSVFDDQDGDFQLGTYGPQQNHKLVLNKFCIVRPQFVLHTIEYEVQEDGLNQADIGAGWLALKDMGENYMVIFNGGVDAGASVGHKHLQIIPIAEHLKGGALLAKKRGFRIEGLPYQHSFATLPTDVDDTLLYDMYSKMLSTFKIQRTEPHNLLLTHSWMMVIPRSKAWIDGISANAASMVGMVWCKSEEQYDGWVQKGIKEVLGQMGRQWEDGKI